MHPGLHITGDAQMLLNNKRYVTKFKLCGTDTMMSPKSVKFIEALIAKQ